MNLVEQQKKHTVQDAVRQGQASSVGFLFWMANAGQIIPPWWSKERDAKLRSFWQDSDHFSGAMFNMAAKLASVPFKVEPRDVTVKAHIRAADEFNMLLNEAPQFGQGWTTFWTCGALLVALAFRWLVIALEKLRQLRRLLKTKILDLSSA